MDFHEVCAGDVTAFVQHQADGITTGSVAVITTALRSFLRYLRYRGAIETDLAACVPTIARWSRSHLPKFLPSEQIQRVIDSCDRKSATGKRNYCILLLLARLGLRATEVVKLTLDDIDWETGAIAIQGKGKRVEQMPLPVEVGAAMADYLQNARPTCSDRRVFIRRWAPLVSFDTDAISSVVNQALKKAGVESLCRGSHVFRHSLATTMLKQGASLSEIGDLLRHRHPEIPLPSMPKSIWPLCVRSPCRGREVVDESTAKCGCRLYGAAAQLGLQVARYGHRAERFCVLP